MKISPLWNLIKIDFRTYSTEELPAQYLTAEMTPQPYSFSHRKVVDRPLINLPKG